MSMRDDEISPTDLEAEGLPALEDQPPGLEDDDNQGRLVAPDQGVAGLDHERDAIATDVADADGLSAEEAAMHVTDIP